MKILLTGAFGNIGESTLRHLLDQGHQVRCFDIKTDQNFEIAKRYVDKLEIMWGDLRNPNHLITAMKDQEAIVHMGFIIPPLSERNPLLASAVNVDGMRNIIAAAKSQFFSPKILFGSSIVAGTVVGNDAQTFPHANSATFDNYTQHIIECEKLLKESGMRWTILRYSPVPPLHLPKEFDAVMFEIPLETRFEFLHSRDAGLAAANAIKLDSTTGKVLLIGGGKKNQMTYREFISKILKNVGIEMLPDSAFSNKPTNLDWIDTAESEGMLKYQRFSFDDYLKQMKEQTSIFQTMLVWVFKDKVQERLLQKSPYYQYQAVS